MARKKLKGDEGSKAYIHGWSNLENEFFKLETLQTYEVFAGWEEFKSGDLEAARKIMRDFLVNDPAKPYEKIRKTGARFTRVHVVELPLSEYLWFEIESYKISQELGEKINFILKEDFEKVDKPVPVQDFLLFDESMVILHNYDNKTGDWQGSELIDTPKDVSHYVAFKKGLLKHATPMGNFLMDHDLI